MELKKYIFTDENCFFSYNFSSQIPFPEHLSFICRFILLGFLYGSSLKPIFSSIIYASISKMHALFIQPAMILHILNNRASLLSYYYNYLELQFKLVNYQFQNN